MHDAVFLNPVPTSAVPKRKHRITSPRLKEWHRLMKKHKGDAKAASMELKGKARKGRSSRIGSASSQRSRTSSGFAARRAASNPKGGVRMAAKRRSRKRTTRRRRRPNKVAWLPTGFQWRQRMADAGRPVKKVKVTSAQWLSTFKRRTKPKAKWRTSRASKARGAAYARKQFRSRIAQGVRMSTKLNPIYTPRQVKRRTRLKTGYVPRYRKRVAPGTRGHILATQAGLQRAKQKAAWYEGALSATKRQLTALQKQGGRRAANPRRRRRKRRRNAGMARYRYPMVRSAAARRMMLRAMRKPRRNRRRRNRRRNPMQSYLAPALPTYGYVLGGAVAGGVVPSLVVGLARKAGVDLGGYGTAVDAAMGIALSIGSGMLVGKYKGDDKGVLVAAGGIGTVVGKLIIKALANAMPEMIPMSGLGADADEMLREAVDVELRRAGLSGMGQFLMPGEAEETPDVGPMEGFGQFLTSPEMHEAVGESVSGFGAADIAREDLTEGGSAAFDGSVF